GQHLVERVEAPDDAVALLRGDKLFAADRAVAGRRSVLGGGLREHRELTAGPGTVDRAVVHRAGDVVEKPAEPELVEEADDTLAVKVAELRSRQVQVDAGHLPDNRRQVFRQRDLIVQRLDRGALLRRYVLQVLKQVLD